MQRGEVWWATFPPPVGTRPVLLLSRDQVYRVRRSATVVLITTSIRRIPVEVALGTEDGMSRECVVNCDELHTIALSRLTNRVTILNREKMLAVARAARFALDLENE